jgi:photosynthetic reaction center cytochrome c subunit
MRLSVIFGAGALGLVTIASLIAPKWDLPPVDATQVGFRGTGMEVVRDRELAAKQAAANVAPPSPYEPDPTGNRARDVYQNVQVLGDLSEDQFNHFMASITEWVSPEQGCAYCHNEENLASDEVYTKVVARRMIQMNQTINVDWQKHVQQTGVTCYTCHRGQPVPANVWTQVSTELPKGWAGYRNAQNLASSQTGYTSLPEDALQRYLLGDEAIRVHSNQIYPNGENKKNAQDVEHTYSLMVHMSDSLGINCTACHNTRAFNAWDESPPQRVTAWHGIRMSRALNNDYLTGLAPVFPANRKGPEGDVQKVNCATCHQGVQKPLLGVSMLKDYVDSLTRKTNTTVPDFTTYKPGETKTFPEKTSDASDPAKAATQLAQQ